MNDAGEIAWLLDNYGVAAGIILVRVMLTNSKHSRRPFGASSTTPRDSLSQGIQPQVTILTTRV